MLTNEDKEKILELRSKGFSYQKIHDITGFSISTIMKVCREAKEKKVKELKEKKSEKAEQGGTQTKVLPLVSTIDGVQDLLDSWNNLLKSGRLKGEYRRIWEKQFGDLKEFVRVEVDDRIASERADAEVIRDEWWRKYLENNYFKKEIATGLENTITDLSNTIQKKVVEINTLKIEIKERDDIISEKESEISKVEANHNLTIERIDDIFRGMIIEDNYVEEVLFNCKKLLRRLLEEEKVDKDWILQFFESAQNV